MSRRERPRGYLALLSAATFTGCGGSCSETLAAPPEPADAGAAESGGGHGTAGGSGAEGAGGAGTGGGAGSSGGNAGSGPVAEAGSEADAAAPGWHALPWATGACDQVLQADDPQAAIEPMQWEDCGSGAPGCKMLDTSKVPGYPFALDRLLIESRVVDTGATTRFEVIRKHADGTWEPVVYDLDQGPRAAWRYPYTGSQPCWANPINLDGERIALRLAGPEAGPGYAATVIGYGTMEQLAAGAPGIAVFAHSDIGTAVGYLSMTEAIMAFTVGLGGRLYVWDYAAQHPTLVPQAPGTSQYGPPWAVGDRVIFNVFGTADVAGVVLRLPDGTQVSLRRPSDAQVGEVDTDGKDVVWTEARAVDGEVRMELWSAAWTVDPADFSPRAIRTDLPFGVVIQMGEGWVTYVQTPQTLRILRLADGAYHDVAAPPGRGFGHPSGVVRGEAWTVLTAIPSGISGYSLMRVSLASLGEPKP